MSQSVEMNLEYPWVSNLVRDPFPNVHECFSCIELGLVRIDTLRLLWHVGSSVRSLLKIFLDSGPLPFLPSFDRCFDQSGLRSLFQLFYMVSERSQLQCHAFLEF